MIKVLLDASNLGTWGEWTKGWKAHDINNPLILIISKVHLEIICEP